MPPRAENVPPRYGISTASMDLIPRHASCRGEYGGGVSNDQCARNLGASAG